MSEAIDKSQIEQTLIEIVSSYLTSFSNKRFSDFENSDDPLMNLCGVSAELKSHNRQYWGRELGMCWERLIVALCKTCCADDFQQGLKIGKDTPCDVIVGTMAIDTKYRIGSGDSGTLKKLRSNGHLLTECGYEPVMLVLRSDSLPAAIAACASGGWRIYTADATFDFLQCLTRFDLKKWMQESGDAFAFTKSP